MNYIPCEDCSGLDPGFRGGFHRKRRTGPEYGQSGLARTRAARRRSGRRANRRNGDTHQWNKILKDLMKLAPGALDRYSKHERDFSALTLSLSSDGLKKAGEEIAELRKPPHPRVQGCP